MADLTDESLARVQFEAWDGPEPITTAQRRTADIAGRRAVFAAGVSEGVRRAREAVATAMLWTDERDDVLAAIEQLTIRD